MRVAESLFVPILPFYVKALDTSMPLFVVGLVTSIHRFGTVLITPVSGTYCDRVGYRKPYLVGVFLASGACILGGFSSSSADLGLYRLLSGIGYGTVTIATMAFVNQVTTLENRATAMGLIFASMLSGAAIGPLPGGYIAQSFDTLLTGYRATFLIGGLIELLVGVYAFFLITGWERQERISPPQPSQGSQPIGDLFRKGSVSVTSLACFLFGLSHGAFLYFTLPLLCDSFGFRPSQIGWIISTFGVGHVLGSLLLGPISDHLRKRKLFVFFGFFGPGLVILLFNFLHHLTPMVFGTFLLGLMTSPCSGIVPTLIAESAPKNAGAAMGMAKSAEQLGLFVGPIIGGASIPSLGFANSILVYGAITIIGSLIFLAAVSEPVRSARRHVVRHPF